jgi:hypothetical protein
MNAIEERRSIGGIEHGQSPAQLGGGLVKAEWAISTWAKPLPTPDLLSAMA